MKLTKIEWDLFEKFRCEVIFNQMESLRDFEKIFKFKVLQQSADLDVSLSLNRDMSLPLIFNESASGRLIIKPSLPIKNVFVICSHSHIFGFQTKALDNLQDLSLDLNLRATKIGDLNIKFLVRHSVLSRFGFTSAEPAGLLRFAQLPMGSQSSPADSFKF